MRLSIVLTTILLLTAISLPANADGGFVPMIDPASHAADITEPTQKALIVCNGETEHLTLQVSFKGDASQFAWLVPTPSKPEVTKANDSVFHDLHYDTAPRLRYWLRADRGIVEGMPTAGSSRPGPAEPDVQVLEKKKVGIYDIAVLQAGNAGDLLQWLKTNGYRITPKVAPVLSDYISRGWVFTAMRINTGYRGKASVQLHEGVLQSLQFSFPSTEPVYPLKISSLNTGITSILLYVISSHRVDDPLMTTECSLDDRRVSGRYYISMDDYGKPQRLTKLTAKLGRDQMTRDMVLKPASSDAEVPIRNVSPPFIENLGASTLMILSIFVDVPFNLAQIVLMFTVFPLEMISPFLGLPLMIVVASALAGLIVWISLGRKEWDTWITIVTTFVTMGIIESTGSMFISELGNSRFGVTPSILTLVICGVLTPLGLICLASMIRRLGLSSWVTAGIALVIADIIAATTVHERYIFTWSGAILPVLLGFAAYKFFAGRKPARMAITFKPGEQDSGLHWPD